MRRVKFAPGEQRKFLDRVMRELNCPSLRLLNQFGFNIPYSTLKNYYLEVRNLPEDFFMDLCSLAKFDFRLFDVNFLEGNFGQIIGGKKSFKSR